MPLSDRLTFALDTGQLASPSGPSLALNAALTPGLLSLPDLTAHTSFRPTYDALEASGISAAPEISGQYQTVLVNLARARAESLAYIARAWSMLLPGGMLIVDGAKKDGMDAILKSLRQHIEFDQVIPKAHGKIAAATKTTQTLPSWENALELAPNKDSFQTSAGLFSSDSIDEGSALLAKHLTGRIKGRIGDLGAGWGWLSHAALAACPDIEEIHLIEAEARALEAARSNITDERAHFHWADATTHRDKFDAIITNPPFHADRKPDPAIGLSFIRAAANMLKPNGKLLLVANRMLPYEASLEQHFRRVERREQTNRFKIFEAGKPT